MHLNILSSLIWWCGNKKIRCCYYFRLIDRYSVCWHMTRLCLIDFSCALNKSRTVEIDNERWWQLTLIDRQTTSKSVSDAVTKVKKLFKIVPFPIKFKKVITCQQFFKRWSKNLSWAAYNFFNWISLNWALFKTTMYRNTH